MRVQAQHLGEPIERPIDLVHLSKYTLGDRGLETELLGLFRAQADIYVSRLEAAVSEKEWKDAAHSLKGSARGLGAWGLGAIAEESEHLIAPDYKARMEAISRIRDAIGTVNLFIESLLVD